MEQVNENAVTELASTELAKLGQVAGEFYPYDATNIPAEVNKYRVVKCLYKASKDGKKDRDNVFVRIPDYITEELVKENIDTLAEYVVTFLQNEEDKIIKEQHRKGVSKIYTDYLSLDKIISALEESEAGARLNAEKIGTWFDDSILDTLLLAVMDKLGITQEPTEEESAKIHGIIKAYKDKFSSLASGKTLLKEEDRIALVHVIKLAEADNSSVGAKLLSRIEKMKEKANDALLAL